jgi:hypothetical protein
MTTDELLALARQTQPLETLVVLRVPGGFRRLDDDLAEQAFVASLPKKNGRFLVVNHRDEPCGVSYAHWKVNDEHLAFLAPRPEAS